MKKLTFFLMAIFVLNLSSYSQSRYVPLNEVRKIADQNAAALWCDVFPAEPIAYYAANDELIGYRFNYAIGKPFPNDALLKQQCEEASINGYKTSRWGMDEYGTMFVSARKDIGVIQDYSKSLSPEYAYGIKMETLAGQTLGTNVRLKKVYYVNFVNQWFCYTNGSKDVYVNVFPKTQVVDREKFLEITQTMPFFCAMGDYREEWHAYQTGIPMESKAEVWIPNPEMCKFYDWSFGCTPTAAAMLLSWWDYNSINTEDNYARLIDYYYQRWDGIQGNGENDFQVPNIQRELAIHMNTDTINEGTTYFEDIDPGIMEVCNLFNYNNYNFYASTYTAHDVEWYFNKIMEEIGTFQRPVLNHITVDDVGHSECCVAYDAATNMLGVHNTWEPGVQWINRDVLIGCTRVEAGGALGLAVTLEHPLGDTGYNQDGDGEVFISGDVFEIRWDYDEQINSYATLSYSIDGGYNWTNITQNTPNDGVFDWHIPNGLNSSDCRIHISLYTDDDEFAGADASLGNFIIDPGGYIVQLQEEIIDYTESDPDYYNFWHGYTTWCVVGVRSHDDTEWWGIEMFDDDSFEDQLATSYSLNRVEFVVMDGHHSTLNKAIKVNQWIGDDNAIVEFEGENETLSPGINFIDWPSFDVVEMFDVHLTPDRYTFILENPFPESDIDFALFGSNNSAYFAGRQESLASSTDLGNGTRIITIEIENEDDYGLCVWANTSNDNYFVIKLHSTETWTGLSNSSWSNPYNWNLNYVPDKYTDVIIPAGTPFSPYFNIPAYARNILIEAGATLTCDDNLCVYEDFNSEGQLNMIHGVSDLFFLGGDNSYWDDPNQDDIYTNVRIDKENRSDKVTIINNVFLSGYFIIEDGTLEIESPLTMTIGYIYQNAFTVGTGGGLNILGNPLIDVAGGIIFYDSSNAAVASGTIYCGGDFLVENNDTYDIVFAGGTLTMNGNSDQHILNQDDGNLVLHNLTIDNPGNCHIEDGDLIVNGDLLIEEGNLELNGYEVMCAGDVTIMDGGKISVDENAILRVGQSHLLSVNDGGILNVLGEPGDRSMISVMPEGTGYYDFDINGGGTIGARRAIFERMDANGVFLHTGAIVEPAYPFDQCIFQDGISGSAALMVIQNDQDFTVTEAVFPDNTWGGQYNVWKNYNTGNVRFAGATGDFSGQDYEYDPNNLIEWFPVFWSLDIGIMLEGPFNGINMDANINNRLPEYQPYEPALPYFGNPLPEWYHTGEEFVLSIPNTDIVDWVVVELRDAPIVQQALPNTAIEKRAALVNKSGKIVALDGMSQLIITDSFFDNVYVVVWHRNHLGIISAYPLTQTKGTLTYDFTTGPNKAYGGTDAVKELAPGIWGMISGDSDGNGMIDDSDKTNAWDLQAGTALYSGCDFNLDSQVDNTDKNDLWHLNLGYASFIPEDSFFDCGSLLTDTRDGQTYNTVQIGTQCWMAENLNLGSMIQGSASQMDNGDFEKYCYNNTETNCSEYGGLYQWNEMMQYSTQPGIQGICPDEWHIPSYPEWTTLITLLGGAEIAGGKLKEAGTVHWSPPNTGATNESGFTGLPGGYNYSGFFELTHNGYSWSSTEFSSNAYYMRVVYSNSYAYQQGTAKVVGLSVRCLKDINLPPTIPSNPSPVNGAINQSINTALSWSCSDPENDPLTYDVYFGNITPLELVSTGQSSNSFNPETLNYNTVYYWKIVALDGQSNSTEGPVWSFTTETLWSCGDPIVDSRDMQTYNTIQIGAQCWMAENLNIGIMVPGTNEMTNDGIIEKYCYQDIATNCATYGGLYQWTEMMQYSTIQGVQGICMVGWHLPTDAEWCTLTQFIDPTVNCNTIYGWTGTDVGIKMKSTTGWIPGGNATNASGFTGLPGGYRDYYGVFTAVGSYGIFWTSTDVVNTNFSWHWDLNYWQTGLFRGYHGKFDGRSVRCLKD